MRDRLAAESAEEREARLQQMSIRQLEQLAMQREKIDYDVPAIGIENNRHNFCCLNNTQFK